MYSVMANKLSWIRSITSSMSFFFFKQKTAYEIQTDEGSEEEEGHRHREMRPQVQHAPEEDPTAPGERVEMSNLQIVPAPVVPSVVRHVRPEMDEHEADQGEAQ